ncbi:LuxR C-terminal-related transcriptional regulator [Kutzneria sp. NPDC052558]|uniref:helix-turn-helix transcriptional regulator n=1 Tax=Kutzneria sp. NPDC052558 TaxID=3364121 RepID=UPI0037CAAA0B
MGIGAMLGACSELEVRTEDSGREVDVTVLAERAVGPAVLHASNRQRSGARWACVVVTDQFDADSVLLAVRLGVKSVVPASSATAAMLVAAVTGATRGVSLLPADLQAALLGQLDELRSTVLDVHGLSMSLLDARERDVLGQVADGLAIDEIAARIGCPDRVVRTTLHRLMHRLGVNNHSHAVAYALRAGAVT